MFGNYFEYNYRSGISKTIEGDNGESINENKLCRDLFLFSIPIYFSIKLIDKEVSSLNRNIDTT